MFNQTIQIMVKYKYIKFKKKYKMFNQMIKIMVIYIYIKFKKKQNNNKNDSINLYIKFIKFVLAKRKEIIICFNKIRQL